MSIARAVSKMMPQNTCMKFDYLALSGVFLLMALEIEPANQESSGRGGEFLRST